MVWYGMVWYGMVWYGMVWYVWYGYGMVWYGMVWYGMVSWCIERYVAEYSEGLHKQSIIVIRLCSWQSYAAEQESVKRDYLPGGDTGYVLRHQL